MTSAMKFTSHWSLFTVSFHLLSLTSSFPAWQNSWSKSSHILWSRNLPMPSSLCLPLECCAISDRVTFVKGKLKLKVTKCVQITVSLDRLRKSVEEKYVRRVVQRCFYPDSLFTISRRSSFNFVSVETSADIIIVTCPALPCHVGSVRRFCRFCITILSSERPIHDVLQLNPEVIRQHPKSHKPSQKTHTVPRANNKMTHRSQNRHNR